MRPFLDLEWWFTFFSKLFYYLELFFRAANTLLVLKVIAVILIVFFIYLLAYCLSKTKSLFLKKEIIKEKLGKPSEEELKEKHSQKWQEVQRHLLSEITSDWKIAVLEADSLLREALEERGYQGEDIGAMLKNIEPFRLKNLNKAWEAHKIRNIIAHQAEREITRIEVERAIKDYQEVLKELGFI